jgi:hypothetical protein
MTELAKAKLIELDEKFKDPKPGAKPVDVQFNPETLKVTFANQIVQPKGGDQGGGSSGRQFVGDGTTKLALTLWFDVTAMTENPVDDVRRLTQKVIYFMTPKPIEKGKEKGKSVPPATRFHWGSFVFDGIVEGLEESLEYFSPDGKPLRAQITLTIGQQKILVTKFEGDGRVPSTPGQTPMTQAKQGQSLQGMSAANGNSDWKGVAAANGIEDPLRMNPGQLVDLGAGAASGPFRRPDIQPPRIAAPRAARLI